MFKTHSLESMELIESFIDNHIDEIFNIHPKNTMLSYMICQPLAITIAEKYKLFTEGIYANPAIFEKELNCSYVLK
jgi:hypothetical protein